MKIFKILAMIMLGLSLSPFLSSQEMQSGSIQGKVVDDKGQPLPGVSIKISGPRLPGTVNVTTTAEGIFRASRKDHFFKNAEAYEPLLSKLKETRQLWSKMPWEEIGNE